MPIARTTPLLSRVEAHTINWYATGVPVGSAATSGRRDGARWAMIPSKYGPFEFSAITKRPSWRWPNGAKLAFWICANIEVFHLDTAMPNDSQERPTGREAIPMVRQWAQRDFGNRVGVWRMMDVLRKHGVRASAATNSEICLHMPVIVEEMVKLDWEIMGHGKTNTHRVNEISPEQEQGMVREVFDVIE